ncbi:HIRAN domain-containing protein [Halobacillus salinus]|uniref:HIRAN domain-containing protein n=1 Tax=Halobacillus salinus TaxID=192814 RepID=UPI0009A89E8D|nr:HIRAN domain-containing protein [Halobacillus salinus]
METVKSLLLVWKNKLDNLYYHVGTLNYDGTKYLFHYTDESNSSRSVNEALKKGYTLHPAFPELNKKYESKSLFEAFNRRIPDKSRRGYDEILEEFNLDLSSDRMDLLRETRGALSGDPYTFEEPLRLNGSQLKTNFYINGMRHRENLDKNWPDHINEGNTLNLEIEEGNKHDVYAVKILDDYGTHIGYVPGIYAQAVYSLVKQEAPIRITVLQTRPNFAPQWWVRVEMNAFVELGSKHYKDDSNLMSLIFEEGA